ncbi:MAG: ribonuclease D [Acidobacteriota bacterium]
MSYELLQDDRALEDRASVWRESECLGIDTEFIRTRTFFPRLGLIQIADAEGCVLLDAVAIENWEPFVDVLESSEIGKILHSPSEDFEVFQGEFGVLPLPLFETQVAATLVGMGSGVGYQRLVQELFGDELPKGEQRSNWLKRPLTESQCRYAAQDVEYLVEAQEVLAERLEQKGRAEWAMEEFDRLVSASLERLDPQRVFERMKKGGLRSRRDLTLLRRLCEWREQRARKRDIPRGFVLKDDALIEIARRKPESIAELKRIDGVQPRSAAKFGDDVLDVIDDVEELEVEELDPERSVGPPVSRKSSAVERLRQELQEVAEETELPPEFLAPRRVLEQLVRSVKAGRPELPAELDGWRRDVLGDRLFEIATS